MRKVLAALYVVLGPVAGVLMSIFLEIHGPDVRGMHEFFLNTMIAVLAEAWLTLVGVAHLAEKGYSLIPFRPGGRHLKNVLKIADRLEELPDELGRHDDAVADIIHDAILRELDRISDKESTGKAKFSAESVEAFYAALVSKLSAQYEIVATCFTGMDEFWFRRNAGKGFLKINLDLSDRIKIRRLFGVREADLELEPKKRELIRWLSMAEKHECRLIPTRDIKDPHESDMFLVINTQSKKPVLGLSWRFSHQGVEHIEVVYNRIALEELSAKFEDMWNRPSARPTKRYESSGGSALELWESYADPGLPSNCLEYLFLDGNPTVVDEIADYWEGLEGSFIRPSPVGIDWCRTTLKEIVNKAKIRDAASLGCTPETRSCLAELLPEGGRTDVFDLSRIMYDSMNHLLGRREAPSSLVSRVQSQRFRQVDWLHLDQKERYDCVTGVDVLNMVRAKDVGKMLERVGTMLRPGGYFLTQVVFFPTKGVYRDLVSSSRRDLWEVYADLLKENLGEAELFGRLCFSQTERISKICPAGKVARDLVTLERLAAKLTARTSLGVSQRFRFCNSTLALMPPGELEVRFNRAGFTIEKKQSSTSAEATAQELLGWYLLRRGR